MTSDEQKTFPADDELSAAALEFVRFCRAELECRQNSDTDYDAELFMEAMHLVLRKLGAPAQEEEA